MCIFLLPLSDVPVLLQVYDIELEVNHVQLQPVGPTHICCLKRVVAWNWFVAMRWDVMTACMMQRRVRTDPLVISKERWLLLKAERLIWDEK